jgi:hypothetical protein
MTKPGHPHRLEHWVHLSLLTGLLVSGGLLFSGLFLALFNGRPRPEGPPPTFREVVRAAAQGDGVALIYLGLLVLIGTPVVRVAVLALGWGMICSWRFMAVSLVVLALLAVSFFLGVG